MEAESDWADASDTFLTCIASVYGCIHPDNQAYPAAIYSTRRFPRSKTSNENSASVCLRGRELKSSDPSPRLDSRHGPPLGCFSSSNPESTALGCVGSNLSSPPNAPQLYSVGWHVLCSGRLPPIRLPLRFLCHRELINLTEPLVISGSGFGCARFLPF